MTERVARSVARESDSGREIVAWLAERFTYADAPRWEAYCERGELLVNGSRTLKGYRLRAGDEISFLPRDSEEPPSRGDFGIIHEDEDFLILDKPAHLVCHPGGRFFKRSLWALLRDSGREGFHFASRLDRETSGVMAVLKSERAIRHWEAARAAKAIVKTYIAVVHGAFPETLETRGFLLPDPGSAIRKKRRFLPGPDAGADGAEEGEACSTSFRLVQGSCGLSLLEARLESGRGHQIRATLRSLGYPVLGDKLYGVDEGCFLRFAQGRLDDADKARLVIDRQALHSLSLRFPGLDGRAREYRAEPPPELELSYLSRLS